MENYHQFKLFDKCVIPILCYGSEIWGYEYSDKIEKVHRKFCKRVLGVSSTTNNAAVLGECGRLPLCVIYFKRCISYWLKILCMPETRHPKSIYLMLKGLDENNKITWATKVRNLLFKYGFGFVWLNQGVGDNKEFLKQFELRIIDCCKQDWHDEVNMSEKLCTYKCFKSLLEIETYLLKQPFSIAKTLAKFRCSNHIFEIEAGRHSSIPKDQRKCKLCNCTEDEFHVIIKCPLYADLRKKYIHSKYWKVPDFNSFCNLMNTKNLTSQHDLGLFIIKATEYKCDDK